MSDLKHIPVMQEEAIKQLKVRSVGLYIDATLGGGGHAEKILELLSGKGRLIGIDRDKKAIALAKKKLKDFKNFEVINENFTNALQELAKTKGSKPHCAEASWGKVDGVLFDLGVSSFQLDEMKRGFSFSDESAVLDMRMDVKQKMTAADILNDYSKESLEKIFREYGEEKQARKISEAIVKNRKERIKTVGDLLHILRSAIPQRRINSKAKHYASDVFRALRMEVNRELENVEAAIPLAVKLLRRGGRVVIITFHSLEDRLVKNILRNLEKPCVCPPELPECTCKRKQEIKIITRKALKPSQKEIEKNPRARSAQMRVAEKV